MGAAKGRNLGWNILLDAVEVNDINKCSFLYLRLIICYIGRKRST